MTEPEQVKQFAKKFSESLGEEISQAELDGIDRVCREAEKRKEFFEMLKENENLQKDLSKILLGKVDSK